MLTRAEKTEALALLAAHAILVAVVAVRALAPTRADYDPWGFAWAAGGACVVGLAGIVTVRRHVRALVAEHAGATDSKWAAGLLHDWDRWRDRFVQVIPKEMLDRLDAPLSDQPRLVAAE